MVTCLLNQVICRYKISHEYKYEVLFIEFTNYIINQIYIYIYIYINIYQYIYFIYFIYNSTNITDNTITYYLILLNTTHYLILLLIFVIPILILLSTVNILGVYSY